MFFNSNFFSRQDNTNQTISDSVPPQQPKVKAEGERGARVNAFKSEARARTVASTRMKVEQPISRKAGKRERGDWLDDAPPVASSSSDEVSVWELEHEFYQQANEEVKREGMEVEEIKEEQFKPTKKILTTILEKYHQSQAVENSRVGDQLRKFPRTKDDSFKCGLCGYEAEMKEKLETHWEIGCEVMQVEEKHGKPEAYQCGGCAVRKESISLIEHHTYYECQGFTTLPLDTTY